MIVLRYDRGSLLIHGEVGTPYGRWDPRVGAFRAMALHYYEVLAYLKRSNMVYRDEAANPSPLSTLSCRVKLRSYQKDALDAWFDAGRRGVIVLPTAAGKTFVALKAIETLNVASLVVVPTLDLLDQWRQLLSNQFGIEVGIYGGGEDILRPLTVSTYDSAYIRAEQLGNKFMFIVFDEVHHLPAPSYSQIAEMYIAPFRMGLTATYEREDGGHYDLPQLVGGRVYQLGVDALAGKHLSPYTHEKILVDLTPDERRLYRREYAVFVDYLRRRRMVLRSPEDFRRFIMMTGVDPEAREALLARNKALKTALNSEAKIKALGEFLNIYGKEKILIFTRFNQLVYRISRRFLVPAITHQTPREERKEILEKFKAGEYRAIVTSQVLDEGVNVPDASIGFILSGTGSSREFIQRLGRILRKRQGKHARLVEIVSRETVETKMSQRRHR
ncbi:MAG: DEAD/DEAH box helicase family protein [Candidatus Bathyarchaeota archaeon]|nr:MAG: DEAD/DEAH box helicase family protein [Candidatus Bathyarchaeota archaeon]